MVVCQACGMENKDPTQDCVRCGNCLGPAVTSPTVEGVTFSSFVAKLRARLPWFKLALILSVAMTFVPCALMSLVGTLGEMTVTLDGKDIASEVLCLLYAGLTAAGSVTGVVTGGVIGALGLSINRKITWRQYATFGAVVGGVLGAGWGALIMLAISPWGPTFP